MTHHYPDVGSASDWLNQIFHAAQPIKSTTQIWAVTCYQYRISALVSQMSFGGETCSSSAKCRLLSQTSPVGDWLISGTWQILRVLKQLDKEGTAFALQMARTLCCSDDHIEITVTSSSMRHKESVLSRVQYCSKVNHQSHLLSRETSVLSWEMIVSLFTMLKSEIVYPV